MADQKQGRGSRPAAALPESDIDKLRDAVQTMDSISKEAFSRIRAVARLALLALESPRMHDTPVTLMTALSTLASMADTAENDITQEAESVGCNWTDDEEARGFVAAHEAQQASVARFRALRRGAR